MLAPLITNNIEQIKTLCVEHKVKELYAFGSVVSDRFNEESDVDLLVEFMEINYNETEIKLYTENYFDFIEKLEKLFGREVDLVTARFLRNRFFIKRLNETKQMLFAA